MEVNGSVDDESLDLPEGRLHASIICRIKSYNQLSIMRFHFVFIASINKLNT